MTIYDVPFRIAGHYEKGRLIAKHPFTISPDGMSLVFASYLTGHGDLYRMDIDGKNVRSLIATPDFESDPCYSPDGHSILFCRETAKCGHIWIMNADGSNQRQLTFGSDYDECPIIAPTGDRILFQRTFLGTSVAKSCTFIMTADGKQTHPLDASDDDVGHQAAISPRDGNIYYSAENLSAGYTSAEARTHYQIWNVHPDGTHRNKITNGMHPNFSADGSQVAFLSGGFGSGNEVWTMKTDGSKQHSVYTSKSSKRFLSCTPNRRELFFQEELSQGEFISAVSIDGSHYRRITEIDNYRD